MSVFFSNIYNKMCWTSVWYICTSLGHNNIVLCIPNCVYIVYARFTHEFCTHSSHYYIWYCTHWRFLWSYHHYDTLHVCNHYRVHWFYHLSSLSVFLAFLFIIGWAWASPTLIVTSAPALGMMVRIYLCIIYSEFCHTLVPEIRVCPEMLHVFRYINVFSCMIYNCM